MMCYQILPHTLAQHLSVLSLTDFMYLGISPVYVDHVCAGALRSQRLELAKVVSQHVGTGNQTLVLWKNTQSS